MRAIDNAQAKPPVTPVNIRPASPSAPPRRYNAGHRVLPQMLICGDYFPDKHIHSKEITVKDEEIQRLLLPGVIASMSVEQQWIIEKAKGKIKEVLAGFPVGEGVIAVSLLVAELTQD